MIFRHPEAPVLINKDILALMVRENGLADCKSRGDLSLRDRLRRPLIPFASEHWLFPSHSTNKKALDKQGLFYWLGWLDSNQRMTVSKTVALPLGDSPICGKREDYNRFFFKKQVFFYQRTII